MAFRRRRRDSEIDPFTDLLFNALLAFFLFFVIALAMLNPRAKAGDVPAKAEVMITVSWPDGSPNDIDTWLEDPGGALLWFRQRDVGLMHLDRDDRGARNDSIVVNGREVVNPLNQEVVTLRGLAAGEYVLNVHYYDSRDGKPMDVTVSVIKVNPRAQIVFHETMRLPEKGAERTAARFTIDPRGGIGGINTLPKRLVKSQ